MGLDVNLTSLAVPFVGVGGTIFFPITTSHRLEIVLLGGGWVKDGDFPYVSFSSIPDSRH